MKQGLVARLPVSLVFVTDAKPVKNADHAINRDVWYWIGLAALPDIGSGILRKLMERFPSGQALWDASPAELRQKKIPERLLQRILQAREQVDTAELWNRQRGPWDILTLQDSRYPQILREIADPPPVLYVRGNLEVLNQPMLAAVGTRRPSTYGLRAVEHLVPPLSRAGLVIVSGLAYGIDAAAHEATLATGGKTIGVLGFGIDQIHPVRHAALAQRMLDAGGALISEHAPGVLPQPFFFPIRNRIIAGLSLGTLVVEAPAMSGALITSSCALESNREVFAVPGDLFRSQSVGVNALIAHGAHVASNAEDILETLHLSPEASVDSPKPVGLSADEERLYDAMGNETPHIDALVQKTNLDAATVARLLSQMELKGLIEDTGGMLFRRKKN